MKFKNLNEAKLKFDSIKDIVMINTVLRKILNPV
jgi:hypothetical protein